MENNKKLSFIINTFYILTVGTIIYFTIKYLLEPLLPFITALIIVSVSEKLIRKISTCLHSRKAAVLLFTLVFIFILSFIIYSSSLSLLKELSYLSESLTTESVNSFFTSLSQKTQVLFRRFTSNDFYSYFSNAIKELDDKAIEMISGFIPSILPSLMKFLSFFPTAIIFVTLTFIAIYYIGCDYGAITDFFLLQLSEKQKESILEAKDVFTATAKELFKSYFLLTIITFTQLIIGFSILKIKYALLLALIICIVDLLPILGTGTVLIPWSITCFVLGDNRLSVSLIVLYGIITLFRQIAQPRIVGTNTGLSPLLSLISIFAGLKLIGFWGIILFPMIATVITSLNKKGIIHLYKNPPEKSCDIIRKTRQKFLSFKRQDK